ncbi:hypothetical protein ACQKJ1_24345 [Methylorubrum rhodesianum]|uniref:hypothetical protein n=1 Tax=Methylorubrum rhodesianum TaxID=29427 RepID=UPI003CFE0435
MGLTYAQGEELRHEVRERVALDWRTPGLRLEAIAYAARRTAESWPMPPRVVDWDWQRIIKRKAPTDVDLAVWHGDVLCGLAYGQGKPGWLELGWVEGNPHGHPLSGQVMDLALAVLRTQAFALDIPETRLKNPFEELREAYRRRGWRDLVEVDGAVYLCRRRP